MVVEVVYKFSKTQTPRVKCHMEYLLRIPDPVVATGAQGVAPSSPASASNSAGSSFSQRGGQSEDRHGWAALLTPLCQASPDAMRSDRHRQQCSVHSHNCFHLIEAIRKSQLMLYNSVRSTSYPMRGIEPHWRSMENCRQWKGPLGIMRESDNAGIKGLLTSVGTSDSRVQYRLTVGRRQFTAITRSASKVTTPGVGWLDNRSISYLLICHISPLD